MKTPLIGGVVSLTTIDYPGRLASVIFFQGCPWRCRYCHNSHLFSISAAESLPWEDVLNLIELRKGFVEGVVFSGGEPLFQECLPNAIMDVKRMGFKIGLHTGGSFPDRFAKVLPLIDWVGFDFKYAFDRYRDITGIQDSGIGAKESLKELIASGVDFEARMTVDPPMETAALIDALKEASALGVKKFVLQKCRDKDNNVIEHKIFSDKILLEDLSKYFEDFQIRG
ncbi:MAG: anaerobic ribonucleoside-triphosphate reductase activating protein [Holosporaceae bacterium]|jgi:pyruvate formate lyase activating enzyme|nr:anaerobic ribonucleoside-triphosphate reductase activating protein [Holosporaceae bacterium]